MNKYEKIEKAIKFLSLHIGTIQELGKPTLLHSINVGVNLLNDGYEEDIIIAGFLHDIIEDTKTVKDEIENEFGKKVLDLILANSKDFSISKENRDIELYNRCAQFGKSAMLIKAYDIYDNYMYFFKIAHPEKMQRSRELLILFLSKLPITYTEEIFEKLRKF